jgi:hypothetical protein
MIYAADITPSTPLPLAGEAGAKRRARVFVLPILSRRASLGDLSPTMGEVSEGYRTLLVPVSPKPAQPAPARARFTAPAAAAPPTQS